MDETINGSIPGVPGRLRFCGFQAGEILLPVAALMNQKAELLRG
jgi:hypothetical protein